jgi:hypothetical protein
VVIEDFELCIGQSSIKQLKKKHPVFRH